MDINIGVKPNLKNGFVLHLIRSDFILATVADYIRKKTTRFKQPTSPERQVGHALYRLAHGCSYTTAGDLFGVAPSTARHNWDTKLIINRDD